MSNEPRKKARVGVYVCHCGGNISDVVKVKEVSAELGRFDHVEVAKDYVFMCSDAGQKMLIEDLQSGKIDKAVVAACSPALHELTFRKCMAKAGKNKYQFEHTNIREQCSWVHKSHPDLATQKAIALIKGAVGKVLEQEDLEPIKVKACKHVLVIGGGIAGIQAALALAENRIRVTLVEQNPQLGGKIADLDTLYPHHWSAEQIISELTAKIRATKLITVVCNDRVTKTEGYVGQFKVTLRSGVVIEAGAIVLATGFAHYQPTSQDYGYGSDERVITMPAFIDWLKGAGTAASPTHHGKQLRHIAFIHCVGSRQLEGIHQPDASGKLNEYCSRVCCTQTLHVMNEVAQRFPQVQLYDFYRDIRSYGKEHEEIYAQTLRSGALFFRFKEDLPPVVDGGNVRVHDVLSWNEEIEVNADLIVLATGMVAAPQSELISMLKLPVGQDRFFQESHPKLRPVEININGIFLAGTCQAPMDVTEAVTSGLAVACKGSILLKDDELALDPFIAQVNPVKCDGCEQCLAECSYPGALIMNEQRKAVVTAGLCVGCGACVAVCPQRAIDINGYSLTQIEKMVGAIAEAP